ncbi:single-stranded DNA-binding protein [Escherichia coli]|nr:single-stranded DNA-binding protein [Escherichia coli]
MARKGVNEVTLVGFVGNAPVISQASSGDKIAVISVATTETWTDRKTGAEKRETEWHRVVIFGKTAEITEQYVKKAHCCTFAGNCKPVSGWTETI